MKMMQGDCFLACSNMSRTREAPTPTNISTKSEPEIVKNGTFASPAIALASNVLPVPGRPDHQDAARNPATEFLKLAGIAQEIDEFLDVLFRFVDAGDVRERRLDLIFRKQPRLALAERHRSAAATRAALHLPHEKHEHRNDDQDREARDQQLRPDALLLRRLSNHVDVVVDQLVHQFRIVDRRADDFEVFARLALADDHEAVDGNLVHLILLNFGDEARIGDLLRLWSHTEIVEHRQQHRGDDQPQEQIFSHIVQWVILTRV